MAHFITRRMHLTQPDEQVWLEGAGAPTSLLNVSRGIIVWIYISESPRTTLMNDSDTLTFLDSGYGLAHRFCSDIGPMRKLRALCQPTMVHTAGCGA